MAQQVDAEPNLADSRPRTGKPESLAKRLRREVYKALPAATWSLVQQVDPQWTSAETFAHFAAHPDAGVDSRGAACAMQTACAENGLRAWCYEFGDPDRFTHMVVLVEEEHGRILMHDPYLDLEGDGEFFDILERLGKSEAVRLKGGTAARTYVADAGLEDEIGCEWLGIAADAGRGARLQVRGGLGLLEGTSPGYRSLRPTLGNAQLAALLAEPVALLNPLGEDDERDLAERLGLNVGLAASKHTKSEGRPALIARKEDQTAGAVQAQLADVLGQMSGDRSRLFEELMALQSRTIELSGELGRQKADTAEKHREEVALLQADVRRLGEALTAAEGYREEASRAAERLTQIKAEMDDVRAEAQRLADALRDETEARRRAETAAEYSEELSQLTSAVLSAAEQRQSELDSARAEVRRLGEALSVAEAEARLKSEAAANLQDEVSQITPRVLAAVDEHRRELDEAHAQIRQMAAALGAAEAEVRLKADAAEALRDDVARFKDELDSAAREARTTKARRDSVESELRRQLADALAAAERLPAPPKPVEIASSTSRSMISSMTAGSAGVILSDGGIGVRDNRGGCLCYGPYVDLAPGSYRLAVALERPALARLLPSRVIVEIVDGPHNLSRQEVRLQSPRTELSLDFELPPVPHSREIEFRILVGPNAYTKLRDLNLSSSA